MSGEDDEKKDNLYSSPDFYVKNEDDGLIVEIYNTLNHTAGVYNITFEIYYPDFTYWTNTTGSFIINFTPMPPYVPPN